MPVYVGITALNHSSNVRVPGIVDLDPTGTSAPANVAKTLNTDDGGALATNTYYYVVSALGDEGETAFSAEVSQAVVGPTNEVQHVVVNATSGQFKLTYDTQQTADIQFNASDTTGAGSVRAKLEALSNIAPGDVTVTGGPGNSGGANPYVITFTGALAATDVPEMTAVTGTTPLAGGGSSVTVSTATSGDSGDTVTIDWDDFTGAVGYRVYRGTTTALEDKYFEVTDNTFTDVGDAGTSGTPTSVETAVDFAPTHLVPGTTTIVDVDDIQTRKILNHHSSIGQYVVTAVNGSTPSTGTLPANS